MASEPPDDDETTRPKSSVTSEQDSSQISPEATTDTRSNSNVGHGSGSGQIANQASSESEVLIRRRSTARSNTAASVGPDQVGADTEPVLQEYFLLRVRNESGADDEQMQNALYHIFDRALRDPGQESNNEEEYADEPDRHAGASRQSSVSNLSGQHSDPVVISEIARGISELGRRFEFQYRFREHFEKTYELMEERAAIDGGGSASLFNVFRAAVQRLLTTQPISWGTLVTLFEFSYYVMRRFAMQLIEKFRHTMEKAVTRLRELASAIVRYVRTADIGIIDWLVGQGGWGAALELEPDQPDGTSAQVNVPQPTSASPVTTTNHSSMWVSLGTLLIVGAAIFMAWQSSAQK